MRARLVPSRRLALVFVLTLGALLWVVLFGDSARVPLRAPFVPRAAREAPVAVPLEGRQAPRGSRIFRLELTTAAPGALVAHEELQLFLESATAKRALLGARLELRGTGCALVADAREELTSRQPTVFRRASGCTGLRELQAPTALELVVEARGEGALSLLGFQPAGAEPGPLQFAPTRSRPAPLDVRGAFVDYPETAPRIVLLSHMWRIAPGVDWLAALVALATLVACLGVVAFPTRALAGDGRLPSAAAILRTATGAALVASSLGLLHAVLEPPFSGPDEPYHLLGFAELVKDEALARDTVAWMGESHLWRIRYDPRATFRTIDVGRPYVAEDVQLRPTEVAMRSAVLARLWRGVAPPLRGQPAPSVLLALRLVNALVFALAVAAAATLALLLVSEPFPQWIVYPFLFVPSLPFFAMHVSETAILCSVYVLLGVSLAILSLDGPHAHWAGLPLGLATGLMLAGGRSPWPLVPLVAVVLLGRVVLGSRGAPAGVRAALGFWAGFALGAAVFFLALDDAYRSMMDSYAVHYLRFIPSGLRSAAQWLLEHPAAVAGHVAGGAVLEIALRPLRARVAARHDASAGRLTRRVALGLAWLVALSLAGSLVLRYPQLPLEPSHPLTVSERIAAVLGTMATMFRLTEPNFSLSSSFWVGFGWLDTMPKAPFQALLTLPVALALIALLVHIARHPHVRRLLWLLILCVGAAASLALYALSTQETPMALQGRYLIGWYLGVLAVIGTALALDHRRPAEAAGDPERGLTGAVRAGLLLVLAGGVHVYCLCFILRRYF